MRVEVFDKQQAISFFPQIAALIRSIWPAEDPAETVEDFVKTLRGYNKGKFERHILVFGEGDIVGYGRVFGRKISAGNVMINNMGLSGVCVREHCRGRGLGRKIARKAFEFVDRGDFDCTLFQTKVSGFYEKLGARMIKNEVINSLNLQKRPFKEPFCMIYPREFQVGDEQIDLNGDGY
ncbi:MAG: GNAT family N-acetyltransferase [Chitinispirillaceae bacterium]